MTIRDVKLVYSPSVGLYNLYDPFPLAGETIARGESPMMDSWSIWPVVVFTRFPGRRGLERIRLEKGSDFFWTRTMSFSRGVSGECREIAGMRSIGNEEF